MKKEADHFINGVAMYTANPCRHCGSTSRYVSNEHCPHCHKARQEIYNAERYKKGEQ
ncbi:hypothetical protein INE66_004560 [Salmonella enterica subsp. enterica]|nr:hypothetical protein [Salmonella enterica subsp. enterica]